MLRVALLENEDKKRHVQLKSQYVQRLESVSH